MLSKLKSFMILSNWRKAKNENCWTMKFKTISFKQHRWDSPGPMWLLQGGSLYLSARNDFAKTVRSFSFLESRNTNLYLLLVTGCNEVRVTVIEHLVGSNREGTDCVHSEGARKTNWYEGFLFHFHGMHVLLLNFFQEWCHIKHLKMFQRLSWANKNLRHFLFCAFYCILFICCYIKLSILNCSICFLSWKCQCVYIMKTPVCMYIFRISVEMIKAIQCWSMIIFDLGLFFFF
jgi:hypothetical protein